MNLPENYKVTYRCPSNIALVKYWGKFGVQYPQNPSISMTLKNCYTQTTVEFSKSFEGFSFEFYFDGEKKNSFNDKLDKFFKKIFNEFTWLSSYKLVIHSKNTFPHSSGIASSASSMSALSMCLNDFDSHISNTHLGPQKASHVARLGSGSASRSIFKNFAIWGECDIEGSSNEFAIEYSDFAQVFLTLKDSVLIVSDKEKSVSSTVGHSLMNNHPFKEVRYQNARDNLNRLLSAMKDSDISTFIDIVESEALELHGLMMNSNPSFILMRPNTLNIIEKIRYIRKHRNIDLFFTLDAGPNVHLMYFEKDEQEVHRLINEELLKFTVNDTVIHDEIGYGAYQVKKEDSNC